MVNSYQKNSFSCLHGAAHLCHQPWSKEISFVLIGNNVYSFVLPCENSVQTICSVDVSVRIVYKTSYPPRRRSLQSEVRLSGTD